MNISQLLLAQAVCVKGGRIFVVGDDKQAIYGFRGADSNSLDRLKTELNAKELGLTVTYRCPQKVVAIAQQYVPDFHAAPTAPLGEVIHLPVDAILATAAGGDFILSRTNKELVTVCFALLRAGKRAKIQGKDVGKGLLSLVKKLDPADLADLARKLESWVQQEISRAAKKSQSAAEAIAERARDQAGMLVEFASQSGSVSELQQKILDLFDECDPSRDPFIVCSSTHKAKGLEANRVFVLTSTYFKSRGDAQEETNLYYVAITRAKQVLYLVGDKDFGFLR